MLVILLDDVGVEQIAAYGEEAHQIPTPTFDCLCERGVRFERAWATPVCSPARAAMLTGRLADKTGLGQNVGRKRQLDHREVTLGDVGTEAGLQTGFFGKWHLDGWRSPEGVFGPRLQGFDSFRGTLGNLAEAGAPEPGDGKHAKYNGYWLLWGSEPHWDERYATTTQIDDTLRFVEEAEGPWLVVLSMYAAHNPVHNPPEHLLSHPLPSHPTEAEQYRATLEAADTEIGRLLRSMDPQTLADTTVMLLADNGSPRHSVEGGGSQDRVKGSLYEGGVRVPFVVAGPSVSQPGVSDALVHLVDVLPTVASILGPDAQGALDGVDLDGVSFLDQLLDPSAPGATQVATSWIPRGEGFEHAIRNERYKLIRYEDGSSEFFDLQDDPAERSNLLEALSGADFDAYQHLSSALLDPRHISRYDP